MAVRDEELCELLARLVRVRDDEGARTRLEDRLLLPRLPADPVVLHQNHQPVNRHLADPDLVVDELFGLRVPLRQRLNDRALGSECVRDYVPAEAPIQEELRRRLSRLASSAHGEGLPRKAEMLRVVYRINRKPLSPGAEAFDGLM